MKRIWLVVFLVLFLLGSSVGYGAGFLIYEHGAAAMAMAGAFISIANDPSAIFHNPAGIAFLKGTQVSIGTTLITSKGSLELTKWPDPRTAKTWEQDSQLFYPSTVYLTHSLSDKVTLGFGFFTPFGLGARWPLKDAQEQPNPLRFLGYEDDMKTFFFNPTIAFKASDNVSIGFGVSYIYSTVKFKLVQPADLTGYGLGVYDVPAVMEGNGSAFAFNAGLLYRKDKFSLGLNMRSGFNINYNGNLELDLSNVPAPFNALMPGESEGKTSFSFPAILGLGISYHATEKLLLSADLHFVLWSVFDRYIVYFDEPAIEDIMSEQDFDDSFLLRGGLQYLITPKLALRGGVIYDWTPQPVETMDPLLPDANRFAVTAGIGYTFGKVVLDVCYHRELFNDRTAPNRYIPNYQFGTVNIGESIYKMSAHLIGMSLRFVF